MVLQTLLVIALIQADGYLDIHRYPMKDREACEVAVEALSNRSNMKVGCVQDIDIWRPQLLSD